MSKKMKCEKEWDMTIDDVIEAMRSWKTGDDHIEFIKEYINELKEEIKQCKK